MAMTKKEKQYVQQLERKVTEAQALRFTDPVTTDLPIPTGLSSEVTQGYLYNSYSNCVYEAWSNSVYHGRGKYSKGVSASQNPRRLYSTKILALRALRNALEKEAAAKLADIDQMIAAELNSEE